MKKIKGCNTCYWFWSNWEGNVLKWEKPAYCHINPEPIEINYAMKACEKYLEEEASND